MRKKEICTFFKLVFMGLPFTWFFNYSFYSALFNNAVFTKIHSYDVFVFDYDAFVWGPLQRALTVKSGGIFDTIYAMFDFFSVLLYIGFLSVIYASVYITVGALINLIDFRG